MQVDEELRTLLAEQSHELTVSQALDSDLQFAYQLQVEEAINASLSSQPSYSASEALLPQFHLPDNDASDSVGLAPVMAEEIACFEQECNDRERAEAESWRMAEELNRFVHDQAFARALHGLPEEEWMKTGDYFHRPYGEGTSSSSSSSAASMENFRLYFKGLVSEETIGDSKAMLTGIGVAICDTNGSLLFELKKALEGETNGAVAEVKALIEGLNVATMLGLTRVTLVFDDNCIYNYVTGKGRPLQTNIATLVDQVTLLHRRFMHCNLSLLVRKDIKFAYELARDAIVSQVVLPTGIGHRKHLIETCEICFEDCNVGRMFSVNGCFHRYCFSCMKQHVQVKLLQGNLPKCPHDKCLSDLKIESCEKFLTPELYNIMSKCMKEASIPITEKIYCPYPRCSALMSRAEVQQSSKNTFVDAQRFGARECTECHGLFCVNCKVPWHSNLTCFEYKSRYPYPCAEDEKLKSLAVKKLWRQCVKCNNMVELAEGCYHIYCRCGYEFCYICGAEWKDKNPTCKCPIWDERNIIHE